MPPLFYLLGCITLSGLSVLEGKTKKRVERIQLLLTLHGALFFCGLFASLVALGRMDGGRYLSLAGSGVLLLTGGTIFLVARMSRRFEALPSRRALRN